MVLYLFYLNLFFTLVPWVSNKWYNKTAKYCNTVLMYGTTQRCKSSRISFSYHTFCANRDKTLNAICTNLREYKLMQWWNHSWEQVFSSLNMSLTHCCTHSLKCQPAIVNALEKKTVCQFFPPITPFKVTYTKFSWLKKQGWYEFSF